MIPLNRLQALPKGFLDFQWLIFDLWLSCDLATVAYILTNFSTADGMPAHQTVSRRMDFTLVSPWCDECGIFRIRCCSVNVITMQLYLSNRWFFTES